MRLDRLIAQEERQTTQSYEGGDVYVVGPQMNLILTLLTDKVEDVFYQKAGERLQQVDDLIGKVDPEFALKAIIFARQEGGMRTITAYTLARLIVTGRLEGIKNLRAYARSYVRRPDDITEVMGAVKLMREDRKAILPNAVKRGFADAISRFDAYQLAKYRNRSGYMNLKTAIRLLHPQGNDTIGALLQDELKNTNTWEAQLSAAKTPEERESVWASLITEKRLGYLAAIRNIRNILKDVQNKEILHKLTELLTNQKAITHSLVWPYQIYQAYIATEQFLQQQPSKAGKNLLQALSEAIDISTENMPQLGDSLAVIVDTSGSMTWTNVSRDLSAADVGLLLAFALAKKNNLSHIITFDTNSKYELLRPGMPTVEMARGVKVEGGGTYFNKAVEKLQGEKMLVVYSDNEVHTGLRQLNRYLRANKARMIGYDIITYGHTLTNEALIVGGYSPRILSLIGPDGGRKLLQTVQNIQPA